MDEREEGTPGLDDKSAGRHDEDPKADFNVHEDDVLWDMGLLISFNTNLLNLNQ